MSPSPTITRPAPTRPRGAVAPYVAAAVYLALALPFVPGAVRATAHVDALVVTNPTAYDVGVQLVDGDGGRIAVGSLGPGRTARFAEVVDVGDRWTLVFAARDHHVTRRVDRAALDAADWRTTVPAPLGAQLEAAGEPPTPDS